MSANFVLTLSCADRPGIVAAVTTELAALNANIAESNQFWDKETGTFFMRLAFTAPEGVDRDAIDRALRPAAERFGMRTALVDEGRRKRIVVMVSEVRPRAAASALPDPRRLARCRGGGDRFQPRRVASDRRL